VEVMEIHAYHHYWSFPFSHCLVVAPHATTLWLSSYPSPASKRSFSL
jgi:hypothetical protein